MEIQKATQRHGNFTTNHILHMTSWEEPQKTLEIGNVLEDLIKKSVRIYLLQKSIKV